MAKNSRPRPSRFDTLSDAEIQARWLALRPMAFKWFLISTLAAPCLYAVNHFWQPSGTMASIMSVAFRMAIGGAGLFAFLTLMAFAFSKSKGHS